MADPSAAAAASPRSSPLKEIGVDLIDNPVAWLEEVLETLITATKTFLPNLLGALALLVIGWAVALLVRWMIFRFGSGLDALMTIVHRWLGQESTRPRWSVPKLVGNVAFWIVIGYAISASTEQLGLITFSHWVLELLGYLPRVLISAFILFVGYLISSGVRNSIATIAESSGFQHGITAGRLVAGLILAFSLLLALTQLGLDVAVFTNLITLAAAGIFGSVALAFGIGAGDAVRNVIASHYVRKALRPGQRVRIQGLDGVVLDITQVAVIVEAAEGEATIPARHFLENVALILQETGDRA